MKPEDYLDKESLLKRNEVLTARCEELVDRIERAVKALTDFTKSPVEVINHVGIILTKPKKEKKS